MTTATNDYEQALWDNSFYSSTAAITQLSSSYHIHNLKRTVNIPNSELSLLIYTGLLETYPETFSANGARLRRDQIGQTEPRGHAGQKQTSLMKVSPSIRALESALNANVPSRPTPEVIIEENESPDTPVDINSIPNGYGSGRLLRTVRSVSHYNKVPCKGFRADTESEETVRPSEQRVIPKIIELGLEPEDAYATTGVPFRRDLSTPDQKKLAQIEWEITESYKKSDDGKSCENAQKSGKNLTKSYLTPPSSLSKDYPLRKENLKQLDAAIVSKTIRRPVKSMLDVADVPPVSKQILKAVHKEAHALIRDSSNYSLRAVSPKASSVFGTPKSAGGQVETTQNSSAQPKRSATAANIATLAKSPELTTASKRFSFRGFFKLKSKSHSLTKIKEEKPLYEPAKILAKSPSTPNFLEQSLDNLSKSPGNTKGLFRRRKSQSSMDFLSEEILSTMSRLVTEGNLSLRSKPLPLIIKDNFQQDYKHDEIQQQKKQEETESLSGNTQKFPQLPDSAVYPTSLQTPRLSENTLYLDTLLAAVPGPEIDTIREVDDSDYLPKVSENNSDHKLKRWEPESSPVDDNESLDEINQDLHNMTLLELSQDIVGSPFMLPMPDGRHLSYPRPPSDLCKLRHSSVLAKMEVKEQLVGEALFPKSLDPHEVESIVTFERLISMRSLRPNGKRSSYLNYNGSNENVLLGSQVPVANPAGMRRSGSILKNSLSSKSLLAMAPTSVDAAVRTDTSIDSTNNTSQDEGMFMRTPLDHDTVCDTPASIGSYDNFSELIEFTDFIDFDNLDFGSAQDSFGDLAIDASSAVDSPEQALFPESFVEDVEIYVPKTEEGGQAEEAEEVEEVEEAHEVAVREVQEKGNEKEFVEDANQPSSTLSEHVVVIDSSSKDCDYSRLPDIIESHQSLAVEDASECNIAYEIGLHEVQARESGSDIVRPFSMSFKGFNGTLGKSNMTRKHELHQPQQYCNDSSNELSVVGQGFGSSEEQFSDDGREVTDEYLQSYTESLEDADHFAVTAPERPNQINSSAKRRQQHLKNILQFQPPLQSLPFHHDRIPSISDQSGTSSPHLLTSYIGRHRKPSAAAKRSVRFSSRIILYDTYHPEEYDRHPDVATCNQLTPLLAQQIKDELNEFKAAMIVHSSSIRNTHFF